MYAVFKVQCIGLYYLKPNRLKWTFALLLMIMNFSGFWFI